VVGSLSLEGPAIVASLEQEVPEHLVGVDWVKSVPKNEAIKEKGFFGSR